MMHKSQFQKMDPYDWFCGPGSHMSCSHRLVPNLHGKGGTEVLLKWHLCALREGMNAWLRRSSLRREACVDPAQCEGAAGVPQVSVQEEAWLARVAVAVIEAEVSTLQLPQQTEPITDHRGLVPAHLKPRPLQVQLQQQQPDRVQHLLQDQVLQDLPLRALQVHLQNIHLRGTRHYY